MKMHSNFNISEIIIPIFRIHQKLLHLINRWLWLFPLVNPFFTSINFSQQFSIGIYELYLTSTGDKLYHEIMLENKFGFSIHTNYKLAVLMNSYLISIQNHSTHYTFYTDFCLMYSNPKYIHLSPDNETGQLLQIQS